MADNPKWFELFRADPGPAASHFLKMRVAQKRGHPFLVLPLDTRLATQSLSLYPAQTPAARSFKALLQIAITSHFPLGLKATTFPVAMDAPFVRFLSALGGSPNLPPLAIACGNPNVEGQRFIILIFDTAGRPTMVVKAGISETARFLIAKENLFLRSAPTNTPGFPRIGESFESEHIRALSLDYTSGQPPRSTDDAPMFLLATAWLDESKTMPLHETLSWQRLKSATASPFFSKLEKRIADRRFHPSIYHGDFAPWNIKSKENSWTVLDWERGELIGIPGWDCFHFLIQPAILVTRTRTELLAAQVERFLQREDFQNYAKRAHITGSERELLLSYLLHQIDVIKPTEGMAATQNLFAALCSKWLAAD